jgi:hypothetical protein
VSWQCQLLRLDTAVELLILECNCSFWNACLKLWSADDCIGRECLGNANCRELLRLDSRIVHFGMHTCLTVNFGMHA